MENNFFSLEDYQLEKNNLSLPIEDEVISTDLFTTYVKEISKYPLLSPEEEYKYGTMLQKPENNKLLVIQNIDSYTVSSLNIPLLFCSLCNCSSYKSVIDSLLELYNKLNSKSKDSDVVYKYKIESDKLNRALNTQELSELFNIESGETLVEIELLNEVKKFINYKFAFDKMFVSNLRLVISIARCYQKNMELIDLINEGNIGLIKAISKYDVSLGNRFSTYATIWIKQYLKRITSYNNSIIRLPEGVYSSVNQFKRDVDNLEKELGRTLTMQEIANYLLIPFSTVEEYCKYIASSNKVSLDQPVGEESSDTLKDLLPSGENLEDIVMKEALKDDIKVLFSTLTEREKQVIRLRYGLDDNIWRTLAEVAKELSVSVERVRQTETKALVKMRRYVRGGKTSSLRVYLK